MVEEREREREEKGGDEFGSGCSGAAVKHINRKLDPNSPLWRGAGYATGSAPSGQRGRLSRLR